MSLNKDVLLKAERINRRLEDIVRDIANICEEEDLIIEECYSALGTVACCFLGLIADLTKVNIKEGMTHFLYHVHSEITEKNKTKNEKCH